MPAVINLTRFDQCVINMALINICNQESYVGQEMRNRYAAWKEETDAAIENPWFDLHRLTIYIPHPDQQYDNMTLAEGLTRGYNVEVEPVADKTKVPYQIPAGGHFVVVLKQRKVDADFYVAATGIFVRPLAVLSLDLVIDPDTASYQPLVVKHPILRDYPEGWEQKLRLFINQEINGKDLPNVVRYVDRTLNSDYRSPAWDDVYSSVAFKSV